MNLSITTPRFLLRPVNLEDAEDFFELDSNPEVHRYLGNEPVTSIEQSINAIKGVLQQYQDVGLGRMAIIDKKSNEFIGWSGLKLEKHIRPGMEYYDLGYRLKQQYWGNGVATETAIASLDFGFNELNLEVINAAAHHQNAASNHILRKIGMSHIEDFHFHDTLCHFYEIRNSEFF